jgi:hypothetical protein
LRATGQAAGECCRVEWLPETQDVAPQSGLSLCTLGKNVVTRVEKFSESGVALSEKASLNLRSETSDGFGICAASVAGQAPLHAFSGQEHTLVAVIVLLELKEKRISSLQFKDAPRIDEGKKRKETRGESEVEAKPLLRQSLSQETPRPVPESRSHWNLPGM